MNSTQVHLAFTHLPVVLSIAGMVILAISLLRKNMVATRISLYILLVAGLTALPVFFTGEGAEEVVERIPGVSETSIEKHEELAKISMIIIVLTSLLAFSGLLKVMGQRITSVVHVLVLVFSMGAAAVLTQTAHLGGQIRHTELNSSSAGVSSAGSTDANENENDHSNNNENKKDNNEDDD